MTTHSRKHPHADSAAAPAGLDRRSFMTGVATATAAGGLMGPGAALAGNGNAFGRGRDLSDGWLPRRLLPAPDPRGNPGTEAYWRRVRRAFVLDRDYIHMNTGTTGSLPRFAQHNLGVYNLYKGDDPRDWEDNLNRDYPDLFPLGSSLFGASALAARQQQVAAAYNAADRVATRARVAGSSRGRGL
ncbi:twin-arginine translocation signal domain-containing protein [uncultured Thiohalocapsa sp.]|uniref:twin-arginine translocation signal domain-containing protein n=1 Tax=uncultured Thiohalocapsa sp. TaxID=768990 RepID=UPI0025E8FC0A|nr:twin-arginine translocation signal domain-containing protein [uncultured Thiohalocapsa sp.]